MEGVAGPANRVLAVALAAAGVSTAMAAYLVRTKRNSAADTPWPPALPGVATGVRRMWEIEGVGDVQAHLTHRREHVEKIRGFLRPDPIR